MARVKTAGRGWGTAHLACHAFPPSPLLSFFGPRFISRAAKPENLVALCLFALKPNGNACYAGYVDCRKLCRNYFVFLRFDWMKISRHFLNQSEVKPTPSPLDFLFPNFARASICIIACHFLCIHVQKECRVSSVECRLSSICDIV